MTPEKTGQCGRKMRGVDLFLDGKIWPMWWRVTMDMDLVIGVGAGAVIGLMAGNILIPIIWEWYESWR